MFREGARVHDPLSVCPACGRNCPHFSSDFRVMGGKKSVVVCLDCKAVFLNGKKTGDLEVHVLPPDPPLAA